MLGWRFLLIALEMWSFVRRHFDLNSRCVRQHTALIPDTCSCAAIIARRDILHTCASAPFLKHGRRVLVSILPRHTWHAFQSICSASSRSCSVDRENGGLTRRL